MSLEGSSAFVAVMHGGSCHWCYPSLLSQSPSSTAASYFRYQLTYHPRARAYAPYLVPPRALHEIFSLLVYAPPESPYPPKAIACPQASAAGLLVYAQPEFA